MCWDKFRKQPLSPKIQVPEDDSSPLDNISPPALHWFGNPKPVSMCFESIDEPMFENNKIEIKAEKKHTNNPPEKSNLSSKSKKKPKFGSQFARKISTKVKPKFAPKIESKPNKIQPSEDTKSNSNKKNIRFGSRAKLLKPSPHDDKQTILSFNQKSIPTSPKRRKTSTKQENQFKRYVFTLHLTRPENGGIVLTVFFILLIVYVNLICLFF